jgi:hypothetical protein
MNKGFLYGKERIGNDKAITVFLNKIQLPERFSKDIAIIGL